MILEAAAAVAERNFQYAREGKGAPVTARFAPDGFEILDPLE
ncbi:MAG: hypothetical protein UZ16_OP3001001766 [Candidatus Hinthialibacteria bacterium OLB16]|nr:MAG: hypothetical protein UZ16_OP3001001766 [Candidatus Hinthialibacteria bacterium OLB16]